MGFISYALMVLCLLQKYNVLGLSLNLRGTRALIGQATYLDCSLDGATWDNISLRQWRIYTPVTLLFDRGVPTSSATGYQEIISNAQTTGIFSLNITHLTWPHIGRQFECTYGFGTAVYTILDTETEDFKNTNAIKFEEKNGLHIKGNITLDAIYPVPTVNATLTTPSKTEDVTANALTNTTSAASGNLTKVVINVDYVVSNAAAYVTVYLSTPGGYSKSFIFNTGSAGPTTEPPESTSPPPDKCDCPVLSCVGENGFCVLWIIIIVVVVVLVLIAVLCIVWIVFRRRRKQNNKEKENQKNKENNHELNKKQTH